jgi:ubiquinone/menaquinone biosynthesis C-methylase UbiE
VVGVDLASRLLERARSKAMTFDLTNVEFRLADMTALGYEDGRFDAVVSVFSIFFVPDMEGLVRELWRMVRPGGKLAEIIRRAEQISRQGAGPWTGGRQSVR